MRLSGRFGQQSIALEVRIWPVEKIFLKYAFERDESNGPVFFFSTMTYY